jgi:hypothetical protein
MPFEAEVEWLVDTGADVGVVQKQVGDLFDTVVVTALSASPTTGSTGIAMVTGIAAQFDLELPDDLLGSQKVSTPFITSTPVGIKSDNRGSNLIGEDQLAEASACVFWDPNMRLGRLFRCE